MNSAQKLERKEDVLTDRILWVDVAKAICIWFVVSGHCLQLVYKSNELASHIFSAIYSFHMFAFFFLSGLVFKRKNEPFAKFIKIKFQRIILPCYVFTFLWVSYSFANKSFGKLNFIEIFKILFLYRNGMSSRYWFLPCLFITYIVFYFILKMDKRLQVIFIVTIFLLDILQRYYIDFVFPYSAEIIGLSIPAFGIGNLISKYILKPHSSRSINNVMLATVGLIVVGGIEALGLPYVEMYDNYCPSIISYIICGGSGTIFVLAVSVILQNIKSLQKIGKYTLEIYGIHFVLFIGLYQKLFRVVNYTGIVSILLSIVSATSIIFSIYILINIKNRIMMKIKG